MSNIEDKSELLKEHCESYIEGLPLRVNASFTAKPEENQGEELGPLIFSHFFVDNM